jgi:hypothetical protein
MESSSAGLGKTALEADDLAEERTEGSTKAVAKIPAAQRK